MKHGRFPLPPSDVDALLDLVERSRADYEDGYSAGYKAGVNGEDDWLDDEDEDWDD